MKIIKIEEQGLTFDDGTTVQDIHNQDCCEHVYADWRQLEGTDVMSHDFNDITIEKVTNAGFRIDGYFVPCYNSQNGYYGSDLSIVISRTIDISDAVEDQIN